MNELEEPRFSEFLSHPLLLAHACIVSSAYRVAAAGVAGSTQLVSYTSWVPLLAKSSQTLVDGMGCSQRLAALAVVDCCLAPPECELIRDFVFIDVVHFK